VDNHKNIIRLYKEPLPSSRSGVLFNAFSYPTKISPEAIAIFIACHTNVGDTVLDPFAGSGTTGLAGLLCDCPTPKMIETAKKIGVKPKWGARKIILQELSGIGAFIAKTMCNPPNPSEFEKVSNEALDEVEEDNKSLYQVKDDNGESGKQRYTIWSDILVCPKCKLEVSFWDAVVQFAPLAISQNFTCSKCGSKTKTSETERAIESYHDKIIGKKIIRKKRIPIKVYGKTGKRTWKKLANKKTAISNKNKFNKQVIPKTTINWGDLYRKGYHKGITHIHHFYTVKNLIAFSTLWDKSNTISKDLKEAFQLLVLSYNTSHSTLMSRVVIKKNNEDFVLTGAQSGVLYISSLPVEKNIFLGVRRKIKTFRKAFELVYKSKSSVQVINASSTKIALPDQSVDYIFTDPPFGGYIPYSEINQINEAWLGIETKQENEVIVSNAQNKSEAQYGDLMELVFKEMYRVLKNDGKSTVVFHSAKASIWRALMTAYENAGFSVNTSSILDKVQGSFKQVTSTVKVQGDPLLLLEKKEVKTKVNGKSYESIVEDLLKIADLSNEDSNERSQERLYSRFVSKCLELSLPVSMNAEDFYKHIKNIGKGVLN